VAQDQAQLNQQQASLATARLSAARASHQDQAKLSMDAFNLQNDQAALATVEQTATTPGTTYTALPAVGQVVARGQTVYSVNGAPVTLFYGTVPMWREFASGMSDGPDVAELTDNLIQLGFGAGLTPGSHFSQATADAVKRWQASVGLAQTGVVHLGEVVFEPGAIRVTAVHPTVGGAVSPGPVLDATSTTRIVTVALQVTQEYLVHAGDAVGVVLPDGKTTTTGRVRSISTVATAPSGSGNANSTPTVTVTITLDNPAASGNLDQAPVNVNITDQSVNNVLAVPINALLTLAEGGDAVEVVNPDGSRRLVAVQTGLFSNSMVEISGPGISEGMLVEVPSS
jgi:multidrug efflux pump subunit AcrA (membrane-fusion protein)